MWQSGSASFNTASNSQGMGAWCALGSSSAASMSPPPLLKARGHGPWFHVICLPCRARAPRLVSGRVWIDLLGQTIFSLQPNDKQSPPDQPNQPHKTLDESSLVVNYLKPGGTTLYRRDTSNTSAHRRQEPVTIDMSGGKHYLLRAHAMTKNKRTHFRFRCSVSFRCDQALIVVVQDAYFLIHVKQWSLLCKMWSEGGWMIWLFRAGISHTSLCVCVCFPLVPICSNALSIIYHVYILIPWNSRSKCVSQTVSDLMHVGHGQATCHLKLHSNCC